MNMKVIGNQVLTMLMAVVLILSCIPLATDVHAAARADGEYTANVTMINYSNREQNSMSDGAIVKPVKIKIKNGEYTLTCDFQGLDILGQKGYLKSLSYWYDGKYMPVNVSAYHDVVDGFNDANDDGVADFKYPKTMSFPLVNKEAGDEDGYVKVQVFVPVMEALSTGSGTQQALMKIDWSSLKAVSTAGTIKVAQIKGLKAKAQKKGKAALSWNKIKNVSGYKVYRATKKSGKYKLVKTINKASTVKFTDKKLKKGNDKPTKN